MASVLLSPLCFSITILKMEGESHISLHGKGITKLHLKFFPQILLGLMRLEEVTKISCV